MLPETVDTQSYLKLTTYSHIPIIIMIQFFLRCYSYTNILQGIFRRITFSIFKIKESHSLYRIDGQISLNMEKFCSTAYITSSFVSFGHIVALFLLTKIHNE